MPSILYQITLPHLCAGIIAQDGIITAAAPILRWSVGKPVRELAAWVKAKGGKGVRVSG